MIPSSFKTTCLYISEDNVIDSDSIYNATLTKVLCRCARVFFSIISKAYYSFVHSHLNPSKTLCKLVVVFCICENKISTLDVSLHFDN